jgi:F5/8 type C domain-containing protein
MTTQQGRTRRVLEWLWRAQLLRQLRARPPQIADRAALEEAKACHLLAGRVLAGIEPIPALTRDAVARPLLRTAIRKCLPSADADRRTFAQLFEDPLWRARLDEAGLGDAAQASVRLWLLDTAESEKRSLVSQQALLALSTILDTQLADSRAIVRLRWRRVWVGSALLCVILTLVFGVMRLASPPEGPDLAVGKAWHASSAYTGFAGSGVKEQKPSETAFFSTNDEPDPWWSVDLGSKQSIGNVTIVNRADCCPDRAIPVALELSSDGEHWREVARRITSFRTWSATFAATPARYVRLRALRRTFLHFSDVRVHAPR